MRSRHAACDLWAHAQQRPVLGQESQVASMNNALVAITPMSDENPATGAHARANAGFVAHLIATAAQAPQTRVRRRAEPEEALAAYRAGGRAQTEVGRALSRSL
jgi:hypothetical protein